MHHNKLRVFCLLGYTLLYTLFITSLLNLAVAEYAPWRCGPWIALLVLHGKISVFQHSGG